MRIEETLLKQRIFDWVVAHLTHQAVPSLNYEGCAYRGDGGLACAAGCLITDAVYFSDNPWDIEGYNVNTSPVKNAVAVSLDIDDLPFDLIRQLQLAHDQTSDIREAGLKKWRECVLEDLQFVANHFRLETTQLDYMEQRFGELEAQNGN